MAFSAAFRTFFRARGVNLDPPKNIFWKGRQGTLLVRATKEDLDKIETELAVLNTDSGKADPNEKSAALTREAGELIEAGKFEEAAAKVKEAVKLNPTNRQAFRYANVIYEHGEPQARKTLSINTNSEPQIDIRVKLVAIPKKASAAFWKSLAATNRSSGPDGIILSSTQAGAILKSLKSQKGVEVLSEPQVTTLSGRQARIQVGQVQPILMGVTNGDKEPHYNMTNFFSGQEVDLIAYAGPDSGAIQLTATNTLKEFLGYDDPGKERVEVLVGGKPTRVKPPLPHFREHNLAINATVLDGQTLMLGRPQITETVNNKAAKPVARKEAEMKDVVVFITPTLIDAVGNPLRK
jgi:tetratricopeptide (TPR) repeat protein